MPKTTNRQKAILHIYLGAAAIPHAEYVEILGRATGKRSSRDLDQGGFDSAMAAIEAVLWQRVELGRIPDPRDNPGWKYTNPVYWRNKVPLAGNANSRTVYKVKELWKLLRDYLPDGCRDPYYLASIIHKAAGRKIAGLVADGRIHWDRLTADAGRLAVEALKDRLAHSIKG